MTTVRLPIEYEQKLDMLSVLKQKNKSELIKDALDIFFHQEEIEVNSYELGKDYFGKYGSGRTDLSTTYKQELKERLHANRAADSLVWSRWQISYIDYRVYQKYKL